MTELALGILDSSVLSSSTYIEGFNLSKSARPTRQNFLCTRVPLKRTTCTLYKVRFLKRPSDKWPLSAASRWLSGA